MVAAPPANPSRIGRSRRRVGASVGRSADSQALRARIQGESAPTVRISVEKCDIRREGVLSRVPPTLHRGEKGSPRGKEVSFPSACARLERLVRVGAWGRGATARGALRVGFAPHPRPPLPPCPSQVRRREGRASRVRGRCPPGVRGGCVAPEPHGLLDAWVGQPSPSRVGNDSGRLLRRACERVHSPLLSPHQRIAAVSPPRGRRLLPRSPGRDVALDAGGVKGGQRGVRRCQRGRVGTA